MKGGKSVIFSAPSGAGKTTIVKHLIEQFPQLKFSVSATSRPKRYGETDGRDYHFLSSDEFREKIRNEEFIEWEEVYENMYYGTLKSEVQRIWDDGCAVIFDVDVEGGLNLKDHFGKGALAVFVQPPSLEVLSERLEARGTESAEKLKERIDKAFFELDYANRFDVVLVNDNLDETLKEARDMVAKFLMS